MVFFKSIPTFNFEERVGLAPTFDRFFCRELQKPSRG